MIETTKKLIFIIIIGLLLLFIAIYVSGILTLDIANKLFEKGKDVLTIRPLK